MKKFLLWAPRLLAIAFALFLALFALDVFGEGYTGQRLLLALVMHLKWPAMVLAVLALGWRWEWVGTLLFAALGAYYWVQMAKHPSWIVVISGPMFLIAALFLVSWVARRGPHVRNA